MKNTSSLQLKNKILIKALKILRGFILVGLLFVILLPYYEIFLNAINYSGIEKTMYAYWVLTRISFRSIWYTFRETILNNAMVNSLSISLIVATIQTFSCALFGYSFARLKFKGNNVIFWIIILSITIPLDALQIAKVLQFTNDPLFGIQLIGRAYTLYIMALLGAGIRAPLFIYIFRQYFRAVSRDIEEASLVDGCGVLRSFFKIMLPNAKGGIITTFLLTFVWTYNDYYYPALLRFSINDITLVSTRLMAGRYSSPYASALVMILPLLIIYLITQKYLIDGIKKSVIV